MGYIWGPGRQTGSDATPRVVYRGLQSFFLAEHLVHGGQQAVELDGHLPLHGTRFGHIYPARSEDAKGCAQAICVANPVVKNVASGEGSYLALLQKMEGGQAVSRG